ncbi:MAG: WXG100 family type VII secretion target [Anaerolineales bacterium]|nr:WXG100 family type VII secretion target [Anaerolineales bacterium]
MTEKIEANYDELERLSSVFMQECDRVQDMLNTVKNAMGNLQIGGWMGRGADAFYAEMNDEIVPATIRLQEALEEGSRITDQIIVTMQQAEEEAGNQFKTYRL